jgi:FkbM family methyltransferase
MDLNFIRNTSDENLPYKLFNFIIFSPKKLNSSFFANINTHFSTFILQKYELSEKYLIEKYIEKDDVVLELGGCLGVTSLLINKQINTKSAHLVFEIDKEKYKFLTKNKKINNSKFQVINGAISDNKKMFYKSSNNFWGGKISPIGKDSDQIKTYSLSNIFNEFNLNFNTLVMDIEGGEIEIIKNPYLSKFKKIIFENHYLEDFLVNNQLKKELEKNGFTKKESLNKVEYWIK